MISRESIDIKHNNPMENELYFNKCEAGNPPQARSDVNNSGKMTA